MSLSKKTTSVVGWAAAVHTLRPDGAIVVMGQDAPGPTPDPSGYPSCGEMGGKCAEFCRTSDANSSQILSVVGYEPGGEGSDISYSVYGENPFWLGETYVDEAAVFMGLLSNDETGLIKITCVPCPAIFPSVTRNGVKSQEWVADLVVDHAFKIEKYDPTKKQEEVNQPTHVPAQTPRPDLTPAPVPVPSPSPGPTSLPAPSPTPASSPASTELSPDAESADSTDVSSPATAPRGVPAGIIVGLVGCLAAAIAVVFIKKRQQGSKPTDETSVASLMSDTDVPLAAITDPMVDTDVVLPTNEPTTVATHPSVQTDVDLPAGPQDGMAAPEEEAIRAESPV